MNNLKLTIIILILLANLLFAFPASAGWVADIINAAGGGRTELIPDECRIGNQPKNQPCELKHLVQVGVNIAYLILGLVGTAALAMFIYGGVLFLISGGSQQKVSQAKSILTNAVIGILIVFSAWVIVNFVINALTKGREGLNKPAEIFNTQRWDQPLK